MIESPFTIAAGHKADIPAIISSDLSLNYGQYLSAIVSFANDLDNKGFKAGVHVAIVANNSIEFVIALMGMFYSGIVAVPISPRFPDQMILGIAGQTDVAAIFVDQENFARIREGESIRVLTLEETVSFPKSVKNIKAIMPSKDKPALFIMTSGSTGRPKAAMLSLANLCYNALGANQIIPLKPGDRSLLSLPLYHVGGLGILMRSLLAGATVIIPPFGKPLEKTIEEERITHLSVVSTQLRQILLSEKRSFNSLKAILAGGGPIERRLVKQSLDQNLPLYLTYGLTEMGSQVATDRVVSPDDVGLVGHPLQYCLIRISSNNEIEVNGACRFLGYYGRGEPLFDAGGWFATGDLGYFDDEGRLLITGRLDNRFISGGENIQPEEIEAALFSIDGVEEAVVVPVDDEKFGARPVAFVKASGVSLSSLNKLLNSILPRFKLPIRFYPWPEDSSGLKPDRVLLKRKAEELINSERD